MSNSRKRAASWVTMALVLLTRRKKASILPAGGEGDEQLSGAVAGEGPGVGQISWCEERVAGAQGVAFGADLGDELAFEDVEPLVLMGMEVAGWAALRAVGVFDDEEFAVSVLGEDLEGDGGDAEVVDFFEAVFSSRDGMKGR
jgi:hypothetical protein